MFAQMAIKKDMITNRNEIYWNAIVLKLLVPICCNRLVHFAYSDTIIPLLTMNVTGILQSVENCLNNMVTISLKLYQEEKKTFSYDWMWFK